MVFVPIIFYLHKTLPFKHLQNPKMLTGNVVRQGQLASNFSVFQYQQNGRVQFKRSLMP